MSTKQTFIEVNGKRYDALTGKRIETPDTPKQNAGPASNQAQEAPKPSIDGVVRTKKPTPSTHHHTTSHKKTQQSKTLMRQAVKKPSLVTKPHDSKSPSITKFSHATAPVQSVHATPVSNSAKHTAPPSASQHHSTAHNNQIAKHQASELSKSDIAIDKALADARSHLALPLDKERKSFKQRFKTSGKIASAGVALVAVLLFASFFAYQNVPNLAMRVASTRAGFQATMPTYRPAGFSFAGPIEYRSGEVIVNFKSKTGDSRAYAVTQRASNWNNEALLANFVITNDKKYQMYQERNKVIYLYNNSHATWLNNGIWYQIEGEAQLTSDQIIRIANSL